MQVTVDAFWVLSAAGVIILNALGIGVLWGKLTTMVTITSNMVKEMQSFLERLDGKIDNHEARLIRVEANCARCPHYETV